jgi:hypothetical protein
MSSRQNARAQARFASKLAQIRTALIEAGCDTVAKQAAAFGLRRSTTWALLNQGTRAGPSAKVVKRILSSPVLPSAARRKIEEYVKEKSRGRYGHSERRTRAFHDVFQNK